MDLVAILSIGLVLIVMLWKYFGFLYFDVYEFKPASTWKRAWSVLVSMVLPMIALAPGTSERTRLLFSGIAVTTLLVPAMVPEMERKPSSLREWLYVHTIGGWFVDFALGAIVYGVAVLCSAFGQKWVGAYFALAMCLGIGRSGWVRLQTDPAPAIAKPSVLWIFVVFPAVACWAFLIVEQAGLKATNWQTEVSALWMPRLKSVCWAWLLVRWPWLVNFRSLRRL
jgi:hypothetical protein